MNGVAFGEREAVTDDRPQNGDDRHQAEALHHGGEDVLAAHQAAVEQREAGSGHHQDQGGADQHPGVVAGALCGGDAIVHSFRYGLCRSRSAYEQEYGYKSGVEAATKHLLMIVYCGGSLPAECLMEWIGKIYCASSFAIPALRLSTRRRAGLSYWGRCGFLVWRRNSGVLLPWQAG